MRLASILLDAPVEVLLERVSARARAAETDGEGCGIPVEYLERLQAAHAGFYELHAAGMKQRVMATCGAEDVLAKVGHAIGQMRLGPGSPASVMEF